MHMRVQPTTTPTLLRMEQQFGGNWAPPPEEPKKRRKPPRCSWLRDLPWPVRAVGAVMFVMFLVDALLSGDAEFAGEPMSVMVLAALGSGTFSLARSLRLTGLDVSHEATDGVDGVVSWAHALLYVRGRHPGVGPNGTDPLCAEFFPWPTWHVQSVAPVERLVCGDAEWAPYLDAEDRKAQAKCWKKTCDDVLGPMRGCAARAPGRRDDGADYDRCPLPVAPRPVIVARHPLRTIESLVAGFCPVSETTGRAAGAAGPHFVPGPARAAAALLGPDAPKPLDLDHLATVSCAEALARYWRAYYAALLPLVDAGDASLVAREDADATCAVVEHAAQPERPWPENPRLAAAKRACAGKRFASLRVLLPFLRQELKDFLRDGWNNDYDNHLNGPKKATGLRGLGRPRHDAPPHVDLSWADLRAWDPALAADIAAIARRFGYDDAP